MLIETVGVGQSEIEVAAAADTTLVLLAPGMGDSIQAAKAGILEIGDVFVVNKADRDGADSTVRELRNMIALGENPERRWKPPVIKTVASTGEGVDRLVAAIDEHRAWLLESGELAVRRVRRARDEVEALAVAILRRRLAAGEGSRAARRRPPPRWPPDDSTRTRLPRGWSTGASARETEAAADACTRRGDEAGLGLEGEAVLPEVHRDRLGLAVDGADAGGVAAGLGEGDGGLDGEGLGDDLLAQGGHVVGGRDGRAAEVGLGRRRRRSPEPDAVEEQAVSPVTAVTASARPATVVMRRERMGILLGCAGAAASIVYFTVKIVALRRRQARRRAGRLSGAARPRARRAGR